MKTKKVVSTIAVILGLSVAFATSLVTSVSALAQPSGVDMAHPPTTPNHTGCDVTYNCQIDRYTDGHEGNYLLDVSVPYSTCVRTGISFEGCEDGLSVVCADRTEWDGATCNTGVGGSKFIAAYEVVTTGTAPSRVDSALIPNWP